MLSASLNKNVVGASSDLGQSFLPRQKRLDLGWGKNRLSRYDIRAEGALPPSITVIARLKKFAMFLLRELLPKYKHMLFELWMTVIVALILNGCFHNIKGTGLLN